MNDWKRKKIVKYVRESGGAEPAVLQKQYAISYQDAKSVISDLVSKGELVYAGGVRYDYVEKVYEEPKAPPQEPRTLKDLFKPREVKTGDSKTDDSKLGSPYYTLEDHIARMRAIEEDRKRIKDAIEADAKNAEDEEEDDDVEEDEEDEDIGGVLSFDELFDEDEEEGYYHRKPFDLDSYFKDEDSEDEDGEEDDDEEDNGADGSGEEENNGQEDNGSDNNDLLAKLIEEYEESVAEKKKEEVQSLAVVLKKIAKKKEGLDT